MRPNEPGAKSPTHPWGVIGAVGAAGAISPGAAGELFTELSSFTKFRDRVDGLLHDLKTSPAGPGKVGEDTMGRERFGGGRGEWSEADALHGSYSKVIKELEELSQLLSDSIEGMSIAVLGAHKGYENVDLEVRGRMVAIQDSMRAHHKAEQAEAAKQDDGHSARPERSTTPPEDTTGGAGT
ncbi:hypothetical protein [Streptomyces sp. NBC_01435]|uniref:hypothetical protein n=1 Tax=Streptomyces sp. NBC_01435 TaxID=2903865 RepID=UPI002E360290|nr:hypothetical protein [Streptomyces sp. NBC_01435]